MAEPSSTSSATPDAAKHTVLLIDDHPIVRQGLIQLINQEPDLIVSGEASTAREALEFVARSTPEVAIVDISLEDRSGVELIKDFRQRFPTVLCLALSMYDESMYAVRVLRAGGRGYVMKQEVSKRVVTAIRRVIAGQVYVSDEMAARLVGQMVLGADDQPSPTAALSDRELEVLTLVGRGLGTREVAEKLFISVKTVEAHKERLKEKLKLQNSTELVRFAVQFTLDQG